MTKIEIALIICAVLMPVLAMVFVLPKHKKKEKAKPPTTPYVPEKLEKKEEVKPEVTPVVEKLKVKEPRPFEDSPFSTDDFKDYISKRNNGLSAPKRKTPEEDTTFSFDEFMSRKKQDNKPKTIQEEIQSLSPELKAMLVAGVLDKKDFN